MSAYLRHHSGLLILATAFLASCGPTAIVPSPTIKPPTVSATPGTPSPVPQVTISPTMEPPETAVPLATLLPEKLVSSAENVLGTWSVRLLGGGEGDPGVLSFRSDGTYSFDAIGGYHQGMTLDTGEYSVEDGKLQFESDYCLTPQKDFYHCIATYQVFVAMAESGPGSLRFVVIEDAFSDREKTLDGHTFLPPSL